MSVAVVPCPRCGSLSYGVARNMRCTHSCCGYEPPPKPRPSDGGVSWFRPGDVVCIVRPNDDHVAYVVEEADGDRLRLTRAKETP